jgi:hypothetical protein
MMLPTLHHGLYERPGINFRGMRDNKKHSLNQPI